MTTHKTHEIMPEGFSYADRLQVEAFMATSSIPGASKVCLVAGAGELPRLACRLRPPTFWHDEMILAYKAGWRTARVVVEMPDGSAAFDMGYLDQAVGRMKWHTPHCSSHNNSATGCGVA